MNGRTIAEDMEREYQRAALRDTFAAAALTGMLNPDDVHSEFGSTNYKLRACRMAYDWADAMLRERSRAGQRGTETQDSDANCTERGIPDPDSRVWETPFTPQPHATPTQGSVQGEGSFCVSRNAKEPVAWAVLATGIGSITPLCHDRKEAQQLAARLSDPHAEAVPLYRHPQPTLTDEEREAVEWAIDNAEDSVAKKLMGWPADARVADTLRKLLERLA